MARSDTALDRVILAATDNDRAARFYAAVLRSAGERDPSGLPICRRVYSTVV